MMLKIQPKRIIITGDLDQHDRIGEINGLEDFLEKFRGKRSSSIHSIEFENGDIQREEVVKEVLDIYSGVELPINYITPDPEPLISVSDSLSVGTPNGSPKAALEETNIDV